MCRLSNQAYVCHNVPLLGHIYEAGHRWIARRQVADILDHPCCLPHSVGEGDPDTEGFDELPACCFSRLTRLRRLTLGTAVPYLLGAGDGPVCLHAVRCSDAALLCAPHRLFCAARVQRECEAEAKIPCTAALAGSCRLAPLPSLHMLPTRACNLQLAAAAEEEGAWEPLRACKQLVELRLPNGALSAVPDVLMALTSLETLSFRGEAWGIVCRS